MMVVNASAASHSGPDISPTSTQPSTISEVTDRMTSRGSKSLPGSGNVKSKHNKLSRPYQINRRRSKGTIAGYTDSPSPLDTNIVNSTTSSSLSRNVPGGHKSNPANNLSNSLSKAQKLQKLKTTAIQTASKSCHSARLALLCINASANFGPRLKLSLCPRKMRKRIFQEIREEKLKSRRSHSRSQQQENDEEQNDMLFLEQLEQDDETSADEEDEHDGIDKFDDPAGESGKLAFGRRKLAFFDMVTAQECEKAREWLKKEKDAGKKRDREILETYLKRIQQMQAQVLKSESDFSMESDNATAEEDFDFFVGHTLSPRGERGDRFLHNNYPDTKLPSDLSLSLNAALILESLSVTPLESLEGMHKCYDGFVSAGTALLEEDDKNRSTSKKCDVSSKSTLNTNKNSRNKILTALWTILITTLDYTSGETILALARLRSMCGTPRYKRRFTQRIAPLLIRPPKSAIWCLRHQSDMRAIIAVTELLFDNADDVFSPGWHERGRLLLADGRRAESLNAAARQLRALSTNALSNSNHRRANCLLPSSLLPPNAKSADIGLDLSGQQHLAEWEVLAVDKQIRKSIKSVFTKDWTKIRDIPRPQTSSGSSSDGSVSQRRDLRGSMSPRQMQVPLSPHSMGEQMLSVSIGSTTPRLHHSSSMSQQHLQSPSRSPTSSNKALQSMHRQQQKQPQQFSRQQQQPQKMSPENQMHKTSQESYNAPLTPKPITIPPQIANTPVTPPRSPNSPNMKKSVSPSTTRDHLLSTAPQMPIMSSSYSQSLPAPPLSPTPSNSSSHHSQRSHHSHSTSMFASSHRPSAAERKRTVAACRALRAQILRFEESFIAVHDRPPKGPERAPLATTYSQYREWKRFIRADAACRIQALYRGFILRISVVNKANSGAGGEFFSRWRGIIMRIRMRNSVMSFPPQLSIPVEIDELGTRGENGLSGMAGDEGRGDGVEIIISPRAEQTKHFPHQQTQNRGGGIWQRRRNAIGDKASSKALPRLDGGRGTRQSTSSHQHQQHQSSGSNMAVADTTGPTDTRPTIVAPPSVTSSSRGGESSPSSTSLESMTLSELLAEKRSLKNRLKQFDMEFHRKNKRMPVKSEKEPIRYLYEKYNNLKSRIQTLSSSDNNSASSTITTQMHPAQKDHAGGRYSRTSLSSYSVNTESSGEDSIPETLSAGSSRHHSNRRSSNSSSGSLSSGTPTGSTSSDLEALRLEKTQLHQLLRSFERDFYKENQRQVSSFADIRPVASQYRRYKEIKRSIAALQEGKTSGSGSGR